MTAVALLAELQHRGASVAVVGERLRVEAPTGTVTPQMREALAAHKSELLRLLGGGCEHVANDPELAGWYRRNPHLTCARCFLAGRPLRLPQ
jgi:hypothetical protein